jgi:hypothetical protein
VSRELSIEVDAGSVERAQADLAVVPLFASERPLRGSAGRADWRLCGVLSSLLETERISGAAGEAVLVASFGGLRAPLLVLGAGSRAEFDVRSFEALAGEAVARALALRAGSLALSFPDDRGGQVAHERRAVALLAGAARAVAEAQPPVALRLRLLVPREEVTRTADLLRRSRPARFPDVVALRLPGVSLQRPQQPAAPGGHPPPGARS